MLKLSKLFLFAVLLPYLIVVDDANAAKRVRIRGKLLNQSGYHLVLIDGAGNTTLKKTGDTGRFSLRANKLKGSTLTILDDQGRAYGPVVLSVSQAKLKAYLGFSGKLLEGATNINLGNVELKSGYAKPVTPLASTLVRRKGTLVSDTDSEGNPVGAASGGLATALTSQNRKSKKIVTSSEEGVTSPGADTDADGIIDAIDPDIDGDGIVNIADEDFAGNDDATFSSLILDLAQSLNANIGSVTQGAIDAVISAEHGFNIGFWFSLSPESEITGGHVVCSESNSYCNRTTGTAIFGGLTESNQDLVGQLWRDLNMDGSGYPNLEYLNVRGFNAVSAAIHPLAGTEAVHPGDTYLINYTSTAGRIVASKLLVLAPYMVTVPAIKSYTVASTTTDLDYSDPSSVQGTNSNPIVTDGSGIITFNIWRPQRLLYRSETPASEEDRYRDMGHLRYGVTIEGGSRQFTCAGLYDQLSADLTTTSSGLGTDDSPFPDDGAELFPLRDTSADQAPEASRVISFRVDLRTCLTRAGESVGTKRVLLSARGEDLSGGANNAGQQIYVTVQ